MATIHMRPQDIQLFSQVAQANNLLIFVRGPNPASLKYIGLSGFSPKRMECKVKTADRDYTTNGVRRQTAGPGGQSPDHRPASLGNSGQIPEILQRIVGIRAPILGER